MIRAGLLSQEDGHTVIALACEESATCRVTRRVNALVLLEDGRSRQERESTEDAERVVGFFNTYRQLYPVSRNVLRGNVRSFV